MHSPSYFLGIRVALLVALVFTTATTHAFVMSPSSSSFIGETRRASRLCSSPDHHDPFAVLNIDPTFDKEEIKRAYKNLARQYHPDVVCPPDAPPDQKRQASDDFKIINRAYERVLNDAVPKEDPPDFILSYWGPRRNEREREETYPAHYFHEFHPKERIQISNDSYMD